MNFCFLLAFSATVALTATVSVLFGLVSGVAAFCRRHPEAIKIAGSASRAVSGIVINSITFATDSLQPKDASLLFADWWQDRLNKPHNTHGVAGFYLATPPTSTPNSRPTPRNHCVLSRVTDATGSAASLDSPTPATKAAEREKKSNWSWVQKHLFVYPWRHNLLLPLNRSLRNLWACRSGSGNVSQRLAQHVSVLIYLHAQRFGPQTQPPELRELTGSGSSNQYQYRCRYRIQFQYH